MPGRLALLVGVAYWYFAALNFINYVVVIGVARFIGCQFHGFGGVAVEVANTGGVTFTDSVMHGALHLQNSSDNSFNRTQIYSASPVVREYKVGRNERCPCGSGEKYKKCHGDSTMSKGIVSINSSGKFTDTVVSVDAGGTGIYREDDRTDFERTTVLVGQNASVVEAVLSRLPAGIPREYVVEAIEQIQNDGNAESLRFSKLRIWLMENDFDMKFWAETAVAIGLAVLG